MELQHNNYFIKGSEVFRISDRQKIGNYHRLEKIQYITLLDGSAWELIGGYEYKTTLTELSKKYRGKR